MREHDSIEFKELVATARRFCGLIDGIPGSDNWLEQLSRILPRLHAEVVVLPDPGGSVFCVETADFDDRFDLFSELRAHLGERDMYWLEYDNPSDVVTGDEHRTGSLADDLTDIYFELKRGLELLEAAGLDEVVHLWETGFHEHWGQHLVDAERHLYTLKVSKQLSS
ncbi:MAG: hypothetical protein BMS9Abin06_0657 [Gammaproteobacteria bacterium]|nr:MAG: hypothetical protein BMS9Abin06_0657 [Gammaproteobacteria bacterium]